MHEASELRAKIEIAELITRYATLHDTGDWEAVAQSVHRTGHDEPPDSPG